uniref:Serine/threonine-protein kinase SIK3 n=1 Tax=Ascaris suum TaxID=6253 RepID=F1LCJ9_ASCSU
MAQGGIPSRSPSMEFALECASRFIHGTLSPPLARSGHSTVYWAISGLFGRPVAVKIINVSALDASIAKKFLPRELYFTRLVNHPHLSRALAIKMPSPTKIIIVSEFYSGGTLLNLILHDKFISEQPHASRMFRQLSEAVHYLHIRGVVHRDIKPENVLLDVNGDVKLVDFGFARYISRRERSTSFCGTKPYSAPEILRRKPYDAYAGDWYAMGVLLFTMLTGKWPQDRDLNDDHESKRIAFTTNMTSAEAQALIQSLTDMEPENRGNYETIVRSEWMRGNNRWIFTDHNYIYEVFD